MTATVPMDMLAEIQGWAPAGGFVRSEWRHGARIEPGDLIRHHGWSVVVACDDAVIMSAAGDVLDKSPAFAWRDWDGNRGTRDLYAGAGAEVRTDTRIDPGTIPAP